MGENRFCPWTRLLAGCAMLLVLTVGCGRAAQLAGPPAPVPPAKASSTDPGAPPTSHPATGVPDPVLVKLLPPEIRANGKLSIATDAADTQDIPSEFIGDDGATLTGLDVDLASAVAGRLGLAAEFKNVTAAQIERGVQMGTYQLGISSLAITPDRVGQVTMVSYLTSGTQLASLADSSSQLSVDELCGRTVAALQGTDQVADLAARNQACLNAGKAPIKVLYPRETSELALGLLTKNFDAILADSLTVDYIASGSNGEVRAAGEVYDLGPLGIVLAENQPQLAQAVQNTLRALIADGTYQRILQRWNASGAAISDPQIVTPTNAR